MEQLNLNQEFIQIGETMLTRADALAVFVGLVLIGALILLISIWRTTKARLAQEEMLRAVNEERTREAEMRMAEFVATKNELSGHLAAM